ncbi:MAG: DNA polymerase III subunit beta [Desulfuromonadales bacterium]|nr:DNA polymerase III subunit beta [Desulfuromonadales bacterium]
MEFNISKESFTRALQKIQSIVEKRNTMPILSNALIEASDGLLYITATDLEVGMKSAYPVSIAKEGKITASAKKLYEIIKELSDEEINFSTKENDWIEIKCGKAQFNIVGLSPDEFPYFPNINNNNFITLNNCLLSEMIEKTSYAICNDETKFNLNGVFAKASTEDDRNIIRMVATDGHRLSIAEKEFEGTISSELEKGIIFPKKGIYELKKILEEENCDIMLGFMDNSAIIRKDNTIIVMRLIDGEFPDYTRVIPSANDKKVIISREALLHSLRRMAILSSEKFKGIKFDVQDGGIEISSSNPELGDAREEQEATYNGTPLSVRFNARYLIDVLNVLDDDQVELDFRDDLSPVIMRSEGKEDFMSVIMPMRV